MVVLHCEVSWLLLFYSLMLFEEDGSWPPVVFFEKSFGVMSNPPEVGMSYPRGAWRSALDWREGQRYWIAVDNAG